MAKEGTDKRRAQRAEAGKRFRARHPEIVATANAAYYAKNKAQWAEYAARRKEILKANPSISKGYSLKTNYGITLQEFDAMVAEQDGRCAICSTVAPLNVDHNHLTGEVRGLLCRQCNTGIGSLKESAEIMRSAAAYLTSDDEAAFVAALANGAN